MQLESFSAEHAVTIMQKMLIRDLAYLTNKAIWQCFPSLCTLEPRKQHMAMDHTVHPTTCTWRQRLLLGVCAASFALLRKVNSGIRPTEKCISYFCTHNTCTHISPHGRCSELWSLMKQSIRVTGLWITKIRIQPVCCLALIVPSHGPLKTLIGPSLVELTFPWTTFYRFLGSLISHSQNQGLCKCSHQGILVVIAPL